MEAEILALAEKQLTAYRPQQIRATLEMLDEGNTVPFIARYRKERTHSLDEVQIREIQAAYHQTETLEKRKTEVLKQIEEQGKLTTGLKQQIKQATTLTAVEDLYLPYKQKRRTKATIAKEAGLEPLAAWVLTFPQQGLRERLAAAVNPEVKLNTIEDVESGVHEILAEAFGEQAEIRAWIRKYTQHNGALVSEVKQQGKEPDENGVYAIYYDFQAPLAQLAPHQVLAINRGEKEKVLRAKVAVEEAGIERYLNFRLVQKHRGPAVALVQAAYRDAYKRFIGPAIEREMRAELTSMAEQRAIKVFWRKFIPFADASTAQRQSGPRV